MLACADRYPKLDANRKLAKQYIKDARKAAREYHTHSFHRKVWHRLFDEPEYARQLIDDFEHDEDDGERARYWIGDLELIDPEHVEKMRKREAEQHQAEQ